VLNRSRRQAYIDGEHNLVKVIGHVMRNQTDGLKMFQKLSSPNEVSKEKAFALFIDRNFNKADWEAISQTYGGPGYRAIAEMKKAVLEKSSCTLQLLSVQ
jgi:hypothetical protein